MGIDARIVLRLKQEAKPTKDWIKLQSWQIAASLGADKFLVDKKSGQTAITFADYWEDTGHPEGKVYNQDGDDVVAADNEWLLSVNVWTRWYGVGYERGDILFLCAVADWVEANIKNCAVWYGGDSSGCVAEPFPQEARRALLQHFYSDNGRDYFKYSLGEKSKKPRPASCSLCKPTGVDMNQYGSGGGGNYIAVHCSGCGVSFESRDVGKTWEEKGEKE